MVIYLNPKDHNKCFIPQCLCSYCMCLAVKIRSWLQGQSYQVNFAIHNNSFISCQSIFILLSFCSVWLLSTVVLTVIVGIGRKLYDFQEILGLKSTLLYLKKPHWNAMVKL